MLQSFSDDALTVDPDTGVPVERVLHAPAIHFKGKGFYATDVGREKQRRLLERAATEGANNHDEKFKAERAEKAKKAATAKPAANKKKPGA